MADRAFLERLSKEMADKGLLIEGGWIGYRLAVVPSNATPVQLEELQQAFFAGAQHLFSSLMTIMDPGAEETANDIMKMDLIHQELQKFGRNFELKIMKTKGST